jgi:hypothetical protein
VQDVAANSWNTLRAFVRLSGPVEGPIQLAQMQVSPAPRLSFLSLPFLFLSPFSSFQFLFRF